MNHIFNLELYFAIIKIAHRTAQICDYSKKSPINWNYFKVVGNVFVFLMLEYLAIKEQIVIIENLHIRWKENEQMDTKKEFSPYMAPKK